MATVTITTSGAQDTRIAPAVGAALGLGRNATGAEVKQYLVTELTSVVRNYEQVQATNTAKAGVTDITPT